MWLLGVFLLSAVLFACLFFLFVFFCELLCGVLLNHFVRLYFQTFSKKKSDRKKVIVKSDSQK